VDIAFHAARYDFSAAEALVGVPQEAGNQQGAVHHLARRGIRLHRRHGSIQDLREKRNTRHRPGTANPAPARGAAAKAADIRRLGGLLRATPPGAG
jgi:hypothetical protein